MRPSDAAADVRQLLTSRHDAICHACRAHHVRRLELFGSASQVAFAPESSDIDFLVEFQPLEPGEHADSYFGLLEALEELLGYRVDLVETQAVGNPFFVAAIEATREVLYAA